jgi:hypothetical protein
VADDHLDRPSAKAQPEPPAIVPTQAVVAIDSPAVVAMGVPESAWPAINVPPPVAEIEAMVSEPPILTAISISQLVNLEEPATGRVELGPRAPAISRPVRIGLHMAAFDVGLGRPIEPWASGPLNSDTPGVPATAPASVGPVGGGLSGSTPALIGALNLWAFWRALWLLAKVRPPGVCLPSLAPPG